MVSLYYFKVSKQCKTMLHGSSSFIIHIKTENVYEDISNDVEKGFDTWNYEVNRPLSTGKN